MGHEQRVHLGLGPPRPLRATAPQVGMRLRPLVERERGQAHCLKIEARSHGLKH